MTITRRQLPDGTFETVVASIPSEDVIVRSRIDYIPQYVTDVLGKTKRVTKDVTTAKLIRIIRKEFPDYDIVSIGTPVNYDVAPTHLTRVEMAFEDQAQVAACLKEIAVSDMLIRGRVQPAWSWEMPTQDGLTVMLHVAWFDTVYFMQFKDVFLGDLHCRYSAKFGFDPNDAKITHFRYDDHGDLEEIKELNANEKRADAIKDDVEFIRVFRDGTSEST